MALVAGVDGCPAGWIAVLRDTAGAAPARIVVTPRFADLVALDPAVIAVDMPIGLPERIGPGGRGPETALRPHLGDRQSSVFSVPSRSAVYASDYSEACALAAATSDPPRKVSKQAFFLFPKIREIDALMRERANLRGRVFESHPEGVFMTLNGGAALTEPKKVKGKCWPLGMSLRRSLLSAAGIPDELLAEQVPRGAGEDDLLDALACSVTAARILRGQARSFPEAPGVDGHGLPVAIWA
jgi:predicted RNase H-like nuclease